MSLSGGATSVIMKWTIASSIAVHKRVLAAPACRPAQRPLLEDLQKAMGTTCDLKWREEKNEREISGSPPAIGPRGHR